MNRTLTLRLVLMSVLAAGLALALPQPAEAGCDRICKNVGPPGTFCRECVDVGYYVGASCQQVSPCFCFYAECSGQPGTSKDSESREIAELFVIGVDAGGSSQPCEESEELPEFLRQRPAAEQAEPVETAEVAVTS